MASGFVVHASWDDQAKVWVATSDDIPGLATEADSWDALARKLQIMIPELLEENGATTGADVAFTIRSESQLIAHRPEVA